MNDEEKIINIINTIKPFINSDGGDIEFIKYEDKYVYIKLHGACASCDAIDFTIKDVIYNALKEEVEDCQVVIITEL